MNANTTLAEFNTFTDKSNDLAIRTWLESIPEYRLNDHPTDYFIKKTETI